MMTEKRQVGVTWWTLVGMRTEVDTVPLQEDSDKALVTLCSAFDRFQI